MATTKSAAQIALEQKGAMIRAQGQANNALYAANKGNEALQGQMKTTAATAGAPIVNTPQTTVSASAPPALENSSNPATPVNTNPLAGVDISQPAAQGTATSMNGTVTTTNNTPTTVTNANGTVTGVNGVTTPVAIAKAAANAHTAAQATNTTPEAAGANYANRVAADISGEAKATEGVVASINNQTTELGKVNQEAIANQESYAVKATDLANSQIAQQNALQSQYEAEKIRQKDSAIATIQPLVDSETAYNKAAIDKAAADQAGAINQATIDNEVAQMNANVVYGKLGLSMSTGAVLATQQIAQTGILKIAQIKADGAYKLAGLQKDMNAIQVDHQIKLNSIINRANDDMLAFKEKTINSISAIQNNILLTDKEKNDKITALKAGYINTKAANENKVYDLTRQANRDAEAKLKTVQEVLDKTRTDSRTEVARLVTSGAWDKLSPLQKKDYATKSGLSMQEIEGQKTSTIYNAVSAGTSALMPGVVLSPASAKIIYDDALARMAMGIPASQAVGEAITAQIQNTPEYKKFAAENAQERQLKIQSTIADINAKNRSGRSGGGGGGVSASTMLKLQENQLNTTIDSMMAKAGFNAGAVNYDADTARQINAIKDQAKSIALSSGKDAAEQFIGSALKSGAYIPDINLPRVSGTEDEAIVKGAFKALENSTYYGGTIDATIDSLNKMGIASSEGSATAMNPLYYEVTSKDKNGNPTGVRVRDNSKGTIDDVTIHEFK